MLHVSSTLLYLSTRWRKSVCTSAQVAQEPEPPKKNMSWGYGKNDGPTTWASNFPDARGPRQSPVDITPTAAAHDPALAGRPLAMSYQTEDSLELENPGLSFKANMAKEQVLSGGPLEGKFKLVQFHFHWGQADSDGSEHTVNGKMYPAELHLVHYNADKYADFGAAVTQPDGLAVLGVFLQIGPEDHAGFQTLADHSAKVTCAGAKAATGAAFNPACLLPDDTSRYWTYEGSLTTPPCCESVRWIVFQKEISVSRKQMAALRSLCCDDCGSKKIPDNYRPPLPLGNRQLMASFQA